MVGCTRRRSDGEILSLDVVLDDVPIENQATLPVL